MKRISFVLTLLVLSFGLVNAQEVILSGVDTEYSPGVIKTCAPVTFIFSWQNSHSADVTGWTCGFKFYTTGVCDRSAITLDEAYYQDQALNCALQDGGQFINYFGNDGVGDDTIGLGAFKMFKAGLTVGTTCELARFTVHCDDDCDSLDFCIDSCWYPPSNDFLWTDAAGGVPVLWQGPFCWHMYDVPNEPPVWVDCPTTVTANHCDVATYTVVADDTDGIGGPPVTYYMVSGPGAVTASTGEWSYQPTCADVGASIQVCIQACDAAMACTDGAQYPHCCFNVVVTDNPPAWTECGHNVKVGMGNTVCMDYTAVDPDWCDVVHYYLAGASPTPDGMATVDPDDGELCFSTTTLDGGIIYIFTVAAYSCTDTIYCDDTVEVLIADPFEIVIEKTHNTNQGMHETVDVTMTKGSELFGGFDILIAYDASVLAFQTAFTGPLYGLNPGCGWEYFTYRYGPFGNCGNACPSGLVRVVGIAETNNGANHPLGCGIDCPGLQYPIVLFTLDFLVSDDRTLECMYVPIRFFWFDCGDNALSSCMGDTLFISDRVFDYNCHGGYREITNHNYEYGYPTYYGAQDSDCFVGDPTKVPIRFIDFKNGGIDIVCADSIDARGDINLNEIAYEIADAVLFSNYFVYGIGVFKVNVFGQIAATDVNADGLTLSVADLVYLIRVVVGDAVPYPKLSPVAAEWNVNNGIVSIDGLMGGCHLVVAGNATPELLANNMELKYNFDGQNTNVLVWSQTGESFEGDFLNAGGQVLSAEFATHEGAPVVAQKSQPETFALNQNYPNPFNPATTITFNVKGAWTLNIYNVTGQVVETFEGVDSDEVVWDASGKPSGIYFYKLEANDFTATKKMVLLK